MQWLRTCDARLDVRIAISGAQRAAKRAQEPRLRRPTRGPPLPPVPGSPLAVPGTQVADGDSDDLRRPVWTQPRVRSGELAHHVLSAKASVHQATDIQALVQRHLATTAVSEADRTDICQERTPAAPRTRARCRPLGTSRCRCGAGSSVGPQSHGRQDGDANYPRPSRSAVRPP